MLAIVSAIVAFDRWPESGGASTVERVAVDRPSARRVETVLVRSRRSTPVVRGVFVARSSGTSATAVGAGDVFLVDDREPIDLADGGGIGPPPPSVPFAAPGEGGGAPRFTRTAGPAPVTEQPGESTIIRQATCHAREALGEAGDPLEPGCAPSNPGGRGSLIQTVVAPVAPVAGETVGLELSR